MSTGADALGWYPSSSRVDTRPDVSGRSRPAPLTSSDTSDTAATCISVVTNWAHIARRLSGLASNAGAVRSTTARPDWTGTLSTANVVCDGTPVRAAPARYRGTGAS